jgi:hypothetical protein
LFLCADAAFGPFVGDKLPRHETRRAEDSQQDSPHRPDLNSCSFAVLCEKLLDVSHDFRDPLLLFQDAGGTGCLESRL